MFAAVEGYN